jgi:hypothetical protein
MQLFMAVVTQGDEMVKVLLLVAQVLVRAMV